MPIFEYNFRISSKEDDSSFLYDAFVSYNREDADFVQRCLVDTLERKGGRERPLRLCIHERDFQVGL